MNRALPCWPLLVCLLCAPLAASAQAPDPRAAAAGRWQPKLYPWVPRGVWTGASFDDGAVVATARVQWLLTLFSQRNDDLVLILEGGPGFGLVRPDRVLEERGAALTRLYAHTVQAGLGLDVRAGRGLRWALHVTAGPVFYGGAFSNGNEDARTAGVVEGKLRGGLELGPVVLGLQAGWGELFATTRFSTTGRFVGGPTFGLYLDWR